MAANLRRQFSKNWTASLAGAAIATLAGLGVHVLPFGRGLTSWSYDLLTVSKPVVVPTNAVLVLMDEASHDKLGQPLNAPWDRTLHAQLVNKLSAEVARVIVFDIVFSDPMRGNPAADTTFAEAIARSRRVILAADHELVGSGSKFRMPLEQLRNAAANIGSAEVMPGYDLVVREHTAGPPDQLLSSLSWAAAEFVGAVKLNETGHEPARRWMHYYAPAHSLPAVSYFDALNSPLEGLFRDKAVFIGARIFTKFAGERKDEYRTPYSFWTPQQQFMSGVEIQATAYLNLLRGDWLRVLPQNSERIIIVVFGVIAGWLLMNFRPWSATGLALLIGTVVALVSYVAFRRTFVWFPWLILEAQIGAALSVSVVVNSFRLFLERRLYEQTLALYLSPKLVKKFSQDEHFRQRGAEKQMLTILFSDIANFTTISEGMDSDDLAKLMNKYFQHAVSECIHVTDGTVVKYIGDAIFAFWNAPEQQHDHAVRACEAALRFRDQGVEYVNGQPLFTRIGLHTGVANVGNFGSVQRFDYTALGESINLASRMEALNKYLGTTVLITGATQAEIGGKFTTRFLGKFRLKGFEKSVDVFELLGREGELNEAWHKQFSSALESFRNRDLNSAAREFRRVLELRKEDGPSKFYLHKIEELRAAVLPADWHGEVELKEK
ncbi:MAG: adenylate/guanylate cyclase domain-containing protein [Verrucomicrobia subdivision 3 bacterium]|nr:adenylate/guanylate cyclase domain-containing protein [Limisphaerales bacterium]